MIDVAVAVAVIGIGIAVWFAVIDIVAATANCLGRNWDANRQK